MSILAHTIVALVKPLAPLIEVFMWHKVQTLMFGLTLAQRNRPVTTVLGMQAQAGLFLQMTLANRCLCQDRPITPPLPRCIPRARRDSPMVWPWCAAPCRVRSRVTARPAQAPDIRDSRRANTRGCLNS